jgi:hypothetical protein
MSGASGGETNVGPAPEGATPAPNLWQQRVGAFATAVNKTVDELTSSLRDLVGEPGNDAAAILADPTALTDEDLRAALVSAGPKIPLGVFRKNLAVLRGPQAAAPAATDAATQSSVLVGNLPSIPDDESFLNMLKVGGVLKVDQLAVISATKAALAEAVGVYELPDTISRMMEEFAEEQDEPVGPSFTELRKHVVRTNYAEILTALGFEAGLVTKTRRDKFLAKLNDRMWPAVVSFHQQLLAWQESWTAGMANPGMLIAALAMGQSGRAGIMPPGMMAPPETSGLRASAEDVINTVNKVFGGLGIPIARALAADAIRIKQVLSDPTLPAAIGVANREQMLKKLGISVSSDYVRLEQNVTRYVVAVINLPQVAAGNDELGYLSGLIQLGASIPWDKLPGGYQSLSASNGRPSPRRESLGGGSGNRRPSSIGQYHEEDSIGHR